MRQITKRLLPGQDLKQEIKNLVEKEQVQAGVIASLVGSLNGAHIRIADGKTVKEWREPLEIVSGTGTVSVNGCHIHLSVATVAGEVYGGHLAEGCIVKTTVELIILAFDDATYVRHPDSTTGYDELSIE